MTASIAYQSLRKENSDQKHDETDQRNSEKLRIYLLVYVMTFHSNPQDRPVSPNDAPPCEFR